jgi:methyl-accepting chemotaxis protein
MSAGQAFVTPAQPVFQGIGGIEIMNSLLANLRIFYKMMVGPILVMVFMVFMALVAYWGFSTQKGSLDNIFNERFDGYKKSAKILNDVDVIYADIYRVVSWTHAKYDQQKIDDLGNKQVPAIDSAISSVQKILQSPKLLPEEKKLYQVALEQLNKFKQPVAGLTDLIKTDVFSATMFLDTGDGAFQELNKTLQALMVIEDKLSKEDYDRSIKKYFQVLTTFAVILVFAVVISLFVSFMMARLITAPIHQSIGIIAEISTGDLTQELRVESRDEIGELAQAVDTMRVKISEAVGQSLATSYVLSDAASDQAAALEETSASLDEMASMTMRNASNITEANSLMNSAKQAIQKANAAMTDLTVSMKQIASSSEQTQKIVKSIDEIAFQTNLLALNAAVEAARAGDAGAGFAVVADEVRNLAMRATEAARNTSELIDDIAGKVKGGDSLVTVTNGAFQQVTTSSAKVVELMAEVAAASQEQSQGIDQVNRAMAEMNQVTQQNAASAEELASIMSMFKTNYEGGYAAGKSKVKQLSSSAPQQASHEVFFEKVIPLSANAF